MHSETLTRDNIVDFILDLFARRGSEEYMGEPVSMAQHMEQSAACAGKDGASDELVIAALLHDIGHFVGDFPIDALENGIDNLHEDAGANLLRAYYPPTVTEPIRLHVAAKKYLCAVGENYIKRLEKLEGMATDFEGVEKAYAIQAGRELRIIVESSTISDDKAVWLSRDVAKKVEAELTYPGQIKVTVIRETRSVEYAK